MFPIQYYFFRNNVLMPRLQETFKRQCYLLYVFRILECRFRIVIPLDYGRRF